eukprot:217350-Chlamydomonas_euryale.AAC.1
MLYWSKSGGPGLRARPSVRATRSVLLAAAACGVHASTDTKPGGGWVWIKPGGGWVWMSGWVGGFGADPCGLENRGAASMPTSQSTA